MSEGLFEPWHDYFVLAGTAGVTLLGLLFVAVSLNTGIIMRGNERHLRAQALTAFEALVFTTIFSLLALARIPSVREHALILVAFGVVWLARSFFHLRALGSIRAGLRRRLLLPSAAYAAVVIAGVELLMGKRELDLLFVMATIWLIVTAARNAWSLLVDVGEVRVREERQQDTPSS